MWINCIVIIENAGQYGFVVSQYAYPAVFPSSFILVNIQLVMEYEIFNIVILFFVY